MKMEKEKIRDDRGEGKGEGIDGIIGMNMGEWRIRCDKRGGRGG